MDGKSCDDLGEKIKSLMERKKMALKDRALQTGDSQKIQQLLDYLELEPTELEEYDESLVRLLIDRITMYPDHAEVVFKAGITESIEL